MGIEVPAVFIKQARVIFFVKNLFDLNWDYLHGLAAILALSRTLLTRYVGFVIYEGRLRAPWSRFSSTVSSMHYVGFLLWVFYSPILSYFVLALLTT